MRSILRSATAVAFAAALTAMYVVAEGPPDWAYGFEPASVPAANPADAAAKTVPPETVEHRPGSKSTFTKAQIDNRFGPADWYPGDHPQMPDIVAHGRRPDVWACSLCHYPNGKGRPENAGVSGLPVNYFIEQMHEFRDGNRKSADPRKQNTNVMIAIAKGMTDDEIKDAANYFGAMKWTPWIKVVESAAVPKTYTRVGMFLPMEGNAKEPLGHRIIEMPQNRDDTEVLRDPRSGFIAYAPPGSLERGKKLVMDGAGKTVACGVCHGPDLKSMGPVPGIAGRSPSYVGRQLYDMQQGTRKGSWTELMKPVVSKLSQGDMLDIAAYTSSLKP